MSETVKLEEGEVLCDKCNGEAGKSTWSFCTKCQGTGKLDWVEKARGGKQPKKNDFIFIDSSAFVNSNYSSSLEVLSQSVKVDGVPLNEYMAKKIAEEVDKLILQQLQNPDSPLRTQFKKENI